MEFKKFIEQKSQEIDVYHVSPRSDMFELRPTGSKKGVRSYIGKKQSGVYVAPRFRDSVAWAVTYVGGIKSQSQKPNERLKEKGGGWHGENGPRDYKHLTIYQIKIPKEILEKSTYESFWEPEYFIPEEHMDSMRIIKSKTYSIKDLQKLYEKSNAKRYEVKGNDINDIKKASKTNIAARYYLELIDIYNKKLMKGAKPLLKEPESTYGNEHFIHQKIEQLKKYIITSNNNWTSIKLIERPDKQQIKEIEKIHKEIKGMIESL
jgi:hypothetical protein